jgi:hypothetical protein
MPIIPATEEIEIGKVKVWGEPRQKVSETLNSTKNLDVVAHTCDPAMWEAYVGESWSKASPFQKIIKPKKNMEVAQVVEHLPSKHKALSSNSIIIL